MTANTRPREGRRMSPIRGAPTRRSGASAQGAFDECRLRGRVRLAIALTVDRRPAFEICVLVSERFARAQTIAEAEVAVELVAIGDHVEVVRAVSRRRPAEPAPSP